MQPHEDIAFENDYQSRLLRIPDNSPNKDQKAKQLAYGKQVLELHRPKVSQKKVL